ncbi:RNA polymerase sigma factor [Chitinophaga deserti]|uniref:RNA polymerase sigma factor n=1 Tax=Chitinophaga deserti TaxID=2164099 RepID=UPI0013004D11|nr:sigma-70 family RNA polymerase sigma factor [Chitinophaga deserti]
MGLKCINNEEDVLKSVAEGSRNAFATLYNGYVNQAGPIVYMITGSREHTEDILQELFVKIWNDREKLHTVQRFNAYFYILLRNQTLNYIDRLATERKKRDQYVRSVYLQEEGESLPFRQRLDILDKAIDALPAQQKTVFLLRAQGYRNPEIACRLKLSPDSVKKYNQLALKSIHQFMKVGVLTAFTMAAGQIFK